MHIKMVVAEVLKELHICLGKALPRMLLILLLTKKMRPQFEYLKILW